MPFPLSVSVTDSLAEPGDPDVSRPLAGRVRDWLVSEGAVIQEEGAGRTTFLVPFELSAFVTRPSVLFPFDSGSVEVVHQDRTPGVTLRFSTKRLCAIVAAVALGLGAYIFASSSWVMPGLTLAAGGWLLVFGGHFVIGFARASGALTRLAAEERAAAAARLRAGGPSN